MDLSVKEQIEGFLACMYPIDKRNANRVVNELESCRTDWPLLSQDLLKRDVFAQIYMSLSEAYFQLGKYEKAVDTLNEGIAEYFKIADYSYGVKKDMFHNLGVYQSYLGRESDALKSFRKWIFYTNINNTTYKDIPLYCYKKVSDFTIKDLKNSRITLADPMEFDDPVDCLVFPWMEKNAEAVKTEGEKTAARLINKAFSYVRIKCFVRNSPLPTASDPRPSSTMKKAEYSNVIMWPTYADYHRGICMEYHLPPELQQHDIAKEQTFFLSDINYTDKVSLGDSITLKQGFFTKSIEWEFEKETRLLFYDTSSEEKFKSIDVPKECLKKVFFGLRCSDDDMYRVIKALEYNKVVEFYKMIISADDVYTFDPMKFDGQEFCEEYEKSKNKKEGCCFCSVLSMVMHFFKGK